MAQKNVDIFIDGACDPNPGRGGWGAVLICNGYEKQFWGPRDQVDSFRHQTNNRMEMIAAIEALTRLKEPCKVRLQSDSSYLVNTMTGLYTKGKNLDLWAQLELIAQSHMVEWVKVPRQHIKIGIAHSLANKGLQNVQ